MNQTMLGFSFKILLVFSFCLLSFPVYSQVVLNEVMFDPYGSEYTDEFVEIFNTSETDSVDLTGWRVGDEDGEDGLVDAGEGWILGARGYGVILDADYFENARTYDDLIPAEALVLTVDGSTLGSGGFSNSQAETVFLWDGTGHVVARYTYSIGNASGHSDEKIDVGKPDTPENWTDSRVLNGTPGSPNSVSRLRCDVRVSRFWTEPVGPREDEEVTLWVSVVNTGEEVVQGLSVTFFEDADGDSALGLGEVIGTVTAESNVEPSDSATFSVVWTPADPGLRSMGIWVDFAEDERTSDNLLLVELPVVFSPGTLLINEIMYDPLPDQPEWIEIFNPTEYEVDLRGWLVSDADTSEKSLIADQRIPVPPSGYVVVSEDSSLVDFFPSWEGTLLVPEGFPRLNNDFDTIVLFDPAGVVVDRVAYRTSWGGGDGFSMERISPRLASDDSTNWSSCVLMDGATPGRENSVFTSVLPAQAVVAVAPNPFSPDGDGFEDVTVISYRLPMTTSRVNLRVYDVRGRCIRNLLGAAASGSQGCVIWDGRDDEGRWARIGIYVVFVEGLDSFAGVVTSAKTTVVLAGRL